MPVTRGIQMHTPSPCGGLPTPALTSARWGVQLRDHSPDPGGGGGGSLANPPPPSETLPSPKKSALDERSPKLEAGLTHVNALQASGWLPPSNGLLPPRHATSVRQEIGVSLGISPMRCATR